MDAARAQAIAECGRCHQPEDAHKHRAGEDPESIAVLFALGGPCPAYVASDASLIYQKHLAIASRAPARTPGRVGKRAPLCGRCANRGHQTKDCPL